MSRQSVGRQSTGSGRSLQAEGVPIPSGLSTRTYGNQAVPSSNGGTVSNYSARPRPSQVKQRTRRNRSAFNSSNFQQYTPTKAGNSASGLGLLEAEFFGALVLLVILMFTGTQSYAEQIMSLMKRGTLTCLLFFILALIAGIGENAARVSKGFGALIIVGILVTTPASGAIIDVDNLIKNDWISSGESGTDSGSADKGTSAAAGNSAPGHPTAVQKIVAAGKKVGAVAGHIGDIGAGASTVIGSNPYLEGNPVEQVTGDAGGIARDAGHGVQNVIHWILGG